MKNTLLLLILAITFTFSSFAQDFCDPDSDPECFDPTDPEPAPLDKGVVILLTGGFCLGIRGLKNR